MALTLYYHPLSSFCHKVLIALYENETRFTGHLVNLGDPDARAKFLRSWPLGKMPVLQDDVRDKIIPETSIIIEYLEQHFAGPVALLPREADERLESRLWDRFFDLYLQVPMQKVVGDRLRPDDKRDPLGVDQARTTLRTAYDMIEARMAKRSWAVADQFSIADCAAAPALFYAGTIAAFPSSHTHLHAYFERLLQRASVARVLAEARPYFEYFPYKESIPARFLEN